MTPLRGDRAVAEHETNYDRPENGEHETMADCVLDDRQQEARRRSGAGVLMEFVRSVDPKDFCCFKVITAARIAAGMPPGAKKQFCRRFEWRPITEPP